MTEDKKLRLVPKPEGGPPERSRPDPQGCSMISVEDLAPEVILRHERMRFEPLISGPPFELSIDRWPFDPDLDFPGDYKDRSVQLVWILADPSWDITRHECP